MHCADGNTRKCYPVLCAILADYEEQVLITGVKSGKHCTRCKVLPSNREILTGQVFEWRDELYTREQQRRQVENNTAKEDGSWVHPVACFAWKHPFFNVHRSLATDILHLLLKGVLMHMMRWIEALLKDHITAKKRTKSCPMIHISDASGTMQLDERFRQVGYAIGLKRFDAKKPFSEVVQWTGYEQKEIVRQLVAVVAPLLMARAPYALLFVRAMCDLITIAQYRYHNASTLKYIQQAINQLDVLKEEFRPYRVSKAGNTEPHFNFPKWHAIVHITDDIKWFGALDGLDTGTNGEAHHIDMVKNFYRLTNKRDYLLQICLHNSRRLSVLAMDHITTWMGSVRRTTVDRDMEVPTTYLTGALRLNKTGLKMNGRPPSSRTFTVGDLAEQVKIPDMIDAVAVFVRESRRKMSGGISSNYDIDRRERDPSWVKKLKIMIHPSFYCWILTGKTHEDPDNRKKVLVRCAQHGYNNSNDRRDYAWLQEEEKTVVATVNDGRLVGQIQLIATIIDTGIQNDDGRNPVYKGALVETLKTVNDGRMDSTSGMITVRRWPITCSANPRKLHAFKFYTLPTILRPAHLIPCNLPSPNSAEAQVFFVNNYISWEEYNSLYADTWEADWDRVVKGYKPGR
jgi:hypothetical protein